MTNQEHLEKEVIKEMIKPKAQPPEKVSEHIKFHICTENPCPLRNKECFEIFENGMSVLYTKLPPKPKEDWDARFSKYYGAMFECGDFEQLMTDIRQLLADIEAEAYNRGYDERGILEGQIKDVLIKKNKEEWIEIEKATESGRQLGIREERKRIGEWAEKNIEFYKPQENAIPFVSYNRLQSFLKEDKPNHLNSKK